MDAYTDYYAYPFVEQPRIHTSIYDPLKDNKNFENKFQVFLKNDVDNYLG